MFLVNFLGGYAVIPSILQHNNTYCSYADTIMPQFFFAVGFAFRLTYLRRMERDGAAAARRKAVRRGLALILLGFIYHHLDGRVDSWWELREFGILGFFRTAFQKSLFQTLTHIGITTLWVLPVIAASPRVRIGFALVSGLLHAALSHWFLYDWIMAVPRRVADGGQLGFLTWTIPVLVGSLAYDMVMATPRERQVRHLAFWAMALMAAGYALSCLNLVGNPGNTATGLRAYFVEPPFVPPSRPVDMWTMSQRTGALSYHVFAAGFSLAVYALCVAVTDIGGYRLGLFRTLGTNALAGYILHDFVQIAIQPWVPKDAPLWYVAAAFIVFFLLTYLCMRHLEKEQLFLRL